MRIRKQQRDPPLAAAAFMNAGLHLLAAATGSLSTSTSDQYHAAAVVVQLQTSGDVHVEEAAAIEDEKLSVKVEGEASSSRVSDDAAGCFSKRCRSGRIIIIINTCSAAGSNGSTGRASDSKKLHKGKTETSNKPLALSSTTSDSSSYLDRIRSGSVQQQQTLQSSWSFPQTTRRTERCNGGGGGGISSSSEEKGTRRNLEQIRSLSTNQCADGELDGEHLKIHNTILKTLETPSCRGDPFAQMDADQPDSKKPKALKQAKMGHFFPQSSHQSVGVADGRCCRKRRAGPKTGGGKISVVIPEQSSTLSPLQAAVQRPVPLSPDHPLNHSPDSLLHLVYKVFLQAGKAGLTTREAASRVVEQGFPGFHQGGVMGRVQVGKLLRTSPFFMELEEGRFALFSAIIGGNEDEAVAKTEAETEGCQAHIPKKARQKGRWTGLPPLFKGEVDDVPMHMTKVESDELCMEKIVSHQSKSSRSKLIQLTQEGIAGLGEQCKRTDGKSWHCPLRARLGYQLCDYHLDKLRTKTAATSLPRKPNPMTIVVKQQASSRSTPDDSWLVPKKSVSWRGHSRCLLATLG